MPAHALPAAALKSLWRRQNSAVVRAATDNDRYLTRATPPRFVPEKGAEGVAPGRISALHKEPPEERRDEDSGQECAPANSIHNGFYACSACPGTDCSADYSARHARKGRARTWHACGHRSARMCRHGLVGYPRHGAPCLHHEQRREAPFTRHRRMHECTVTYSSARSTHCKRRHTDGTLE